MERVESSDVEVLCGELVEREVDMMIQERDWLVIAYLLHLSTISTARAGRVLGGIDVSPFHAHGRILTALSALCCRCCVPKGGGGGKDNHAWCRRRFPWLFNVRRESRDGNINTTAVT